MKKTIVCMSILSCFLMLMVPNISAVEYNTVVDVNQEQLLERIASIQNNLEKLKKYKGHYSLDDLRNYFKDVGNFNFDDETLINFENFNIDLVYLVKLLIKGFIIPTVYFCLILIIANIVGEIAPILVPIIIFILVFIGEPIWMDPVIDVLEEKIDNDILMYLLAFIITELDVFLAGLIVYVVIP